MEDIFATQRPRSGQDNIAIREASGELDENVTHFQCGILRGDRIQSFHVRLLSLGGFTAKA